MSPVLSKYRYLLFLGVLLFFSFFVNRGALPTDIMETRNMVTANEMVSDGNYLVPTMNGQLRLEKPPLPTWVAAAVDFIYPSADLSLQRIPSGIMGCVWTLFLFLFSKYISHRSDYAFASCLVFLTCYNLVLMGRTASWDIYCHAFMMGAIYFFTRAVFESRRSCLFFFLSGLFMGLSFLSKGPVSFYTLLLPYLLVLCVGIRPSFKHKWGGIFLLLLTLLVVGGWWYLYLFLAHPEQASFVFHKESGAWSNHNVRPWFYYWRFFLEMGVWAVLMVASLAFGHFKKIISVNKVYVWTFAATLISLLLLSLMPEKKMRYLLPSLAPCSLLVGCLLIHFKQGLSLDRFSRLLYKINGFLIVIVVAALPFVCFFLGVHKGYLSWPVFVVVSICWVALAVFLFFQVLHLRPLRFAAGIAGIFMVAEAFLLPMVNSSFSNSHSHSIALAAADARCCNLSYYSTPDADLRIELVYALRHKILPINFQNTDSLRAISPFVFVSSKDVAQELSPQVLSQCSVCRLGVYDDNKHSPGTRHYTPNLISYVSVLNFKDK